MVERYAWFTDRWGADPTISLLMPNASVLTPTGQVLSLSVQRSKDLQTRGDWHGQRQSCKIRLDMI